MEMEKILRQSILYDFYGEMLNDHQKQIYEDIIFHDLSYTEVAEAEGISRQGVYDLIKRCDKSLEEYEARLCLVEKFQKTKERIKEIDALVHELKLQVPEQQHQEKLQAIVDLTQSILEEC